MSQVRLVPSEASRSSRLRLMLHAWYVSQSVGEHSESGESVRMSQVRQVRQVRLSASRESSECSEA